jgi:hypothetical protein
MWNKSGQKIYNNWNEFIDDFGFEYIIEQEGLRDLQYPSKKKHFDFIGYFKENGDICDEWNVRENSVGTITMTLFNWID